LNVIHSSDIAVRRATLVYLKVYRIVIR